jgi:hypothetical protein
MSIYIDRNSVLVAGVPRSRGTPRHIEYLDVDEGFVPRCVFNGNQVIEMHTSQNVFTRIHELMHARHSEEKRMRQIYARVNFLVMQLTEDCVIHERHWPWDQNETPEDILTATKEWLNKDQRHYWEAWKKDPTVSGSFGQFATHLRIAAVYDGVYGYTHGLTKVDWHNPTQHRFARDMLELIVSGHEKQAAEQIQRAYFGALENVSAPHEPILRYDGDDHAGVDIDMDDYGGTDHPKMEVIELPLCERIPEAQVGYRKTSSGARMIIRELMKPIPNASRMFIKRLPIEAQGTILVDASGSMGSWNRVKEWCEKAPFGTIAYYAGYGNHGQLFVYAKRGRRATEIVGPDGADNVVDGPAIDWLLQQPAPRIMITDRGFCGAEDSFAQRIRLEQLERQGLIEVRNYKQKD